jgi:D-aminoacyl-tRNA deacylase
MVKILIQNHLKQIHYHFMRIVIQRVSEASVTIEQIVVANIAHGLLILVGIEAADTAEDIDWLCQKIVHCRIFGDEQGVMNRSVIDIQGDLLVVSQFTLHASTKKGNRPSYLQAAKPDFAIPMYDNFVQTLQTKANRPIQTGQFGADMKVRLLNDGPVTILIDSKHRI